MGGEPIFTYHCPAISKLVLLFAVQDLPCVELWFWPEVEKTETEDEKDDKKEEQEEEEEEEEEELLVRKQAKNWVQIG